MASGKFSWMEKRIPTIGPVKPEVAYRYAIVGSKGVHELGAVLHNRLNICVPADMFFDQRPDDSTHLGSIDVFGGVIQQQAMKIHECAGAYRDFFKKDSFIYLLGQAAVQGFHRFFHLFGYLFIDVLLSDPVLSES